MNFGKPLQDAVTMWASAAWSLPCRERCTAGTMWLPSICLWPCTWPSTTAGASTAARECKYYADCAGAGKGLSIDTGGLDEFESFDQVLDSYSKQLRFLESNMLSTANKMIRGQQRLKPLPYLSLVVDDCVDKGLDITLAVPTTTTPVLRPWAWGPPSTVCPSSSSWSSMKSRWTALSFWMQLKANWEADDPSMLLVKQLPDASVRQRRRLRR